MNRRDQSGDNFSWSKQLSRCPRPDHEYVPDLLIGYGGVTTVIGPPDDTLTALVTRLALCVGTDVPPEGGDDEDQSEDVLWLDIDARSDMRPTYEAWKQNFPNHFEGKLYFLAPPTLSSDNGVRELSEFIEKVKHVGLVVTPPLIDIGAGSSGSIRRTYRNIRKVAEATTCTFLVQHYSTWLNDEELLTTILVGSDIVVRMRSFDHKTGQVELEHLKRRGGPKPDSSKMYVPI
jgi:hypothetical protein